ncbi:hypothetical protein [Flavobacterium urocaniciphilum]|uniref:Uncharacterized protein n=1 Tax=Flavobacterium urocaniciphilum TaxID=1299341 RepID=A0A1H8ZA12_9FLAO|nr:hypothetical protein [Flavobacterium urocaniciphilum]SEP61202.1 hypothetical protein SAMN05444005_101579 [Flavobacterium urocaniciphilum]
MDFSFISIAITLFVVCVLPFLLYSLKNNKKRKIRFLNLEKIANQNNAVIHEKDIWNQSIIGIDNKNKMLFFSKSSDEFDKFISVNISDLHSCSIEKTVSNHKAIEKLELELKFADKPTIVLEFFNIKVSRIIINELELIQKWHKLLKITT